MIETVQKLAFVEYGSLKVVVEDNGVRRAANHAQIAESAASVIPEVLIQDLLFFAIFLI